MHEDRQTDIQKDRHICLFITIVCTRRAQVQSHANLFPSAMSSMRYASASAGRRTTAISSFSFLTISFSSTSICFLLSTTSISISSLRIFCFSFAPCSSYASSASAFYISTRQRRLQMILFRSHHGTAYVDAAYSYRPSNAICLLGCLSVTIVSPAKTAEPIELPFGLWTHGPKEPCIRRGSRFPMQGVILRGKGTFYRDLCKNG